MQQHTEEHNCAGEIKPIWKGGSYIPEKYIMFFTVATVLLEIFLHETQYNDFTPSGMISTCSEYLSKVAEFFGYYIAYISDIAHLFDIICKHVTYLLKFIWNPVIDAFMRIFSSFINSLCNITYAFINKFVTGLEGTYNMYLTYYIGAMITVSTIVISIILLETYGRINKIKYFRPSYYFVIGIANTCYIFFEKVSYSFGWLSNIAEFISRTFGRLIKRLMPWLTPYLLEFNNSFRYVFVALFDITTSPIAGIYNGLADALMKLQISDDSQYFFGGMFGIGIMICVAYVAFIYVF